MIIATEPFSISRYPQRNQELVARVKRLLAGQYQPNGLCATCITAPLDTEAQKGLTPMSYFESLYR